jgi:hypothetical protein
VAVGVGRAVLVVVGAVGHDVLPVANRFFGHDCVCVLVCF